MSETKTVPLPKAGAEPMPLGERQGTLLGDEATVPAITLPWAPGGDGKTVTSNMAGDLDIHDPAPVFEQSGPGPGSLPYSLEAHLSLAVALDVLTTKMQAVQAGPSRQALSIITQALMAVRQDFPQGENTADLGDLADLEACLRGLALGPVGEARAALAPKLAACTQALGDAAAPADGIVLACAHVTRGAREVIARARLALAATDAKHAQGLKIGP